MKKIAFFTVKEIITIIIILIIATYTLVSFAMKISEPDYQRDMAVVDIEIENEIRVIVLEDINGFTWDYETENYKIGDTVIVYFYDNDTSETIFDDEIIRIETLCHANY